MNTLITALTAIHTPDGLHVDIFKVTSRENNDSYSKQKAEQIANEINPNWSSITIEINVYVGSISNLHAKYTKTKITEWELIGGKDKRVKRRFNYI